MIAQRAALAASVLVVAMSTVAVTAQKGATPVDPQFAPTLPEHYTAFAVNLGNVGNTIPTPVDITITRWTTAAETELLLTKLREKSPEAMRDAMQKMPSVGTISTPGTLAYHFRYASQQMTKNGLRRITLMTDRPIESYEAMNRPLSIDYPFTSIELLVDANGMGKGTLSIATKLSMMDDLLIVEGLADRPIDLNGVKRVKDK